MSAVGKIIKGRARRTRCDGCGRISSDRDGYYFDKETRSGGYINNHGRDCEHDFCKQCEDKLAPEYACPKCGVKPQ